MADQSAQTTQPLDYAWPAVSPLTIAPSLSSDVVHVWSASLDDPPLPPDRLAGVLTPGERAAAEKHLSDGDRARAVATRGLLRWLLGAYLGVEPAQVRLRSGPQGKPELADEPLSGELRFNVSHSEGLAVYALARRRDVGVDVERLRPLHKASEIATRLFAAGEIATLRALPPGLLNEGFLICWTRKEAYVKANGAGLALKLDAFEVPLDRGLQAMQLRLPNDPEEAARWSLYDLRPEPGFVSALAVAGRNLHLGCRTWLAS